MTSLQVRDLECQENVLSRENQESPKQKTEIMKKILQWLRGKFKKDQRSDITEPEVQEIDPYNPFPDPIEIPISDVIDLHTIQPRDVSRVVTEYLNEAHAEGFPVVRIIHGKGIGVQRNMVRTILERTQFVERWTDAPPEAGGLGATIVIFKKRDKELTDL